VAAWLGLDQLLEPVKECLGIKLSPDIGAKLRGSQLLLSLYYTEEVLLTCNPQAFYEALQHIETSLMRYYDLWEHIFVYHEPLIKREEA